MLHGMFHAEEQEENSSFILSTSKVFLTGFPVLFALLPLFFCRSKTTTVGDMNGLKSLSGNKVFIC